MRWVSLDVWISDCWVLHLESSKGSPWLVFSRTPYFFDEFSQGVDACLCAKECCELVWCSFVDYVSIFLVRPAFEHYVLARLWSSAWTVGGFLYVVGLVVFAEVSVSSSSLCYYP